jgi:hypothetical protein
MVRPVLSSTILALALPLAFFSLSSAVPVGGKDSATGIAVPAKPAAVHDTATVAAKSGASHDTSKAAAKPVTAAAGHDSATPVAKPAKKAVSHPAAAIILDTTPLPIRPLPSFGKAVFDSALTDQARIYAGLQPLDSGRYDKFTSTKGWKVHQRLFEENWIKLEKRLTAMEEWRTTELSKISQTGATLFYPFSGPDFLNGDLFFPDCQNSVYISLEAPGEIPSPEQNETHFTNFIEDIRASLSMIFVRNYFITSYMGTQLHTPYLKGNLTLFLVFLARRNCAVVSVNKIHIDSSGAIAAGPCEKGVPGAKQLGGMEIQYIKAGMDSTVRHLYYFPVDIQNLSISKKPQLQAYLKSLSNVIMFTKAASYCMHDNIFSIFRDLCLRSKAVLEDDSGIPYRFFKPEEWNVTLYGSYTKPIKDFHYGFQPDLDKAYSVKANVKPLPFSIGYHWSDGFSNLILAIKK